MTEITYGCDCKIQQTYKIKQLEIESLTIEKTADLDDIAVMKVHNITLHLTTGFVDLYNYALQDYWFYVDIPSYKLMLCKCVNVRKSLEFYAMYDMDLVEVA